MALLNAGPNTATGHTSVLYAQESQVSYLLQLLEPVRTGALNSVAPTDLATDRYNDKLQERLENSVWSQCASWYRVGSRGRIFSTFPGPLVLFWWWLRTLRWEDHEIKGPGAEKWRRRHARWSDEKLLGTATLAGALGTFAFAVLYRGVELSEVVERGVRIWYHFWRAVDVIVLSLRDVSLDAGKCCQKILDVGGGALSLVKNSTQSYLLELLLRYSILFMPAWVTTVEYLWCWNLENNRWRHYVPMICRVPPIKANPATQTSFEASKNL